MPTPRIYAFADEASPLIDQQIAALRRNGLQGLEIRNVDGENVSAISLAKAKEVRQKLDDAGLVTWSIGSPLGKIDIEKDDFEAHLDSLRHTLEVADVLGAKNIRMFSFFLPAEKDPAQFRNEVLDRLHRMVEVSSGSGVALCHENEKGIYGDIASRCLEILTEMPELRGVFDPANFVQCGQDTLEAWELLKDKIYYMHIKDALFADNSVVPAGHGDGHVKEVLDAYRAQGGEDMTVEPHLAVFDGLKGLERKGDRSIVGGAFVFSSNDEAFDAACEALRKLL
ncbi:MAG: sugar phosphate isomerase/epimerase [Clostridia bacterium]|nr:sugar phosphate isomerase/epimerase [Clostridia bacterium]